MNKFKAISFILWPLVVLVIALSAFYFKPWQQKGLDTISVSADGKTEVTPNIAKITATIATTNQNLDQARKDNEKKVSQLLSHLKELGIDQKDIKTQNISAGQTYEEPVQIQIYPPPQRKPTNQISTSLEITIRNFDLADQALAALTQNGATNLYGPNLTVADDVLEQTKSQARQKAVDAARKKGEELAKLSNRKLGKVTSIKEQGDYRYPQPLYAASSMELKEKASQIQPGQNEVSVTLQVDFALK